MITAKYEKLGIPCVNICTTSMLSVAKKQSLTASEAIPYMRIVTIPDVNQNAKNAVALETIPGIVEALTKPLTKQETYVGLFEPPRQPRIAFTGTFDEVQEFFLGDLCRFATSSPHAEYTDGLPVIPPTEDRVTRMLNGTSHKPNEVIGHLSPINGIATVEKVAINSVMAGARPEYMPVLLAVTEAMAKDPGALNCAQGGAGLFGYSVVICGPVSKKIGVNSGAPDQSGPAPLSPGVPANMVIGRFIRLMQINVGGIEPGVNEAKWIGHPYKTSLVVAEDNEGSPWPQMSTQLGIGFKDNESTVTLFSGWADFKGGVGPTRNDIGTTKAQIHNPDILARYLTNVAREATNLGRPGLGLTVMMGPDLAIEFAKAGYTRKDIQNWIYQHAVAPWGEVKQKVWPNFYLFKKAGPRTMQGRYIVYKEEEFDPNMPDNTPVKHFAEPDFITIVVGPGSPIPGAGMVLLNQHPTWTVSVDKWR